MEYRWNAEKDAWLRAERGVGFEDLVQAIERGALLRDEAHPKVERFGHQRVLWVRLDGQVWVIPYVLEDEDACFLKTAFPSRKATRLSREGGDGEEA